MRKATDVEHLRTDGYKQPLRHCSRMLIDVNNKRSASIIDIYERPAKC